MTLASLKSPLAGFSGIIFLPLLLVPVILLSQTGARQPGMLAPAEKETSFKADSLILKYTLPDSFLIPGSESVLADTILLHRNHDYVIHYVDGAIVFKTNYLPSTNIRVRYRIFTAPIRKSYFHRQIIMTDTAATQTADSTSSAKPKPNLAPQTTFGAQLRKSGSLTRGITVGTNQGLQVDSGLRMQIAGRLTEKVEVVASLTDQNTPIQPEGNTQTLQEIDKVFVQIKAPHVQTTLGDYNLSFDGTEFTRYNRKLQGAMGQADFKNVSVTLSGAVSRGRFTTNEFLGQEGNQGPYQLRGSEGQISIIVLAGTERVWVDGQPMTRGESNDYVIEYSNGQVTFTRHRLITADSRITVDFQFSDESYQRNLWGAHGETRFLDERFRFRTTFIRESDDKDNPLSRTLSADFVRALEAAGDSAAIVPGFTFVGPDSGNYIDSSGVFVFIGPKAGDYSVAFSFFGENQGDYRNIGLGRFKFVGENRGSYRPFIILPQAQRHDVVGFNLEAAPAKSITFRSELAMSQFDRNLFSPQNDNDNQGAAYALQFDFQPERFALGNLSLGRINLNARIRRKNARFRDIDRTTQVEFNRRWNVTEAASPEETVVEMHGAYLPSAGLTFEGGVGRLSKSSRFESNRWEAQTSFNQPKLPNFRYFIEFIDRHDRNVLQRSTWLRHRGRADFNLKKLKPILEYEGEIRKDADRDTARAGFSFDSYTGGLDFSPFK
ncbi:MAG TPA: hypothetical protein VGA99_15980, partial [bacterium]